MGFEDQYIGNPIADPNVREGERTYAMFMHLTLILYAAFFPIVVPLIMWQIKRMESTFIDDHGREAVNFQISLVIYMVIALVLSTICIGIPLVFATYALGLVGMILGSIRAYRGCYFRYPMCIRFIPLPSK